jgi:GPH family glycoside/pentoside/hexuronide:cation symporter
MLIYDAFFMAVGAACFWTVFYSMAYDLVEVDEFVSGQRREGIITALPQFFQKFGSAVGMWLVSLVLKLSGYDTGTATAGVIENSSTIIPAAFLLISIFGVFMFPVTKKRFHKLQEVLAKKNLGEDYDTTGLEKMI